jgi:hypothetical protein
MESDFNELTLEIKDLPRKKEVFDLNENM